MHNSTPKVTAANTAYPKNIKTGLFVSIIETIACEIQYCSKGKIRKGNDEMRRQEEEKDYEEI